MVSRNRIIDASCALRLVHFLFRLVCFLMVFSLALGAQTLKTQPTDPLLKLSRPVRTWEFLPVVGTRAALFGDESGRMEAWVYPLKILRELHLTFLAGGRALPAESLSRTLVVHPESATLFYVGDSFRVRETFFVPVHESGAVILFDIETEQPLEIEVGFTADFALEWPAAIGGTYIDWDANRRAFVFGEESRKLAAIVGSPTAQDAHLAYETNYSSSNENSFHLGVTPKGHETKLLVIAGSVAGFDDATKIYQHLSSAYGDLLRDSAAYYRNYLAQTVNLELPDVALQQAYDWARISTIQGLVNNPDLGSGLVAGYRTSGTSQRPGFAWFFGRDSLWTSFALNAEGGYATTRTALEFISKYQREDGKIPHEISQSANLVAWFKDYPYAYVSADATPLFIIAVNDYVAQSGDLSFLRDKWDNVWRAYQFLRSTYDAQGLAQNAGVGHGWVEGGPLLPVRNEFYQAGLGVEALHSLSNLAQIAGKDDLKKQLAAEFDEKRALLDRTFWSPEKKIYAFALTQNNQRAEETSVLATAPMWFGLPDAGHAGQMITQLSEAEHQTDWGMRIISSQSKVYDGSGYHFGSVWPLFTGWASVAEYKYHHSLPAYLNLRSNALLAFDGSLGHFTEVLSGDYYQSFSTSSPHQIWSAAMVVSPILRGMFGLQTDATNHVVSLTPHVPADWTSFGIRNVHAGSTTVDFQYQKAADSIVLETKATGPEECAINFSPALSLRAHVVGVEVNGRPWPFKLQSNDDGGSGDQHVFISFPVHDSPSRVVIRLKNDFGLSLSNELPPLGSASRGLRVLSESWNPARTQLTVEVSGLTGRQYELAAFNGAQISSVEGARLAQGRILFELPGGGDDYHHHTIVLHFGKP